MQAMGKTTPHTVGVGGTHDNVTDNLGVHNLSELSERKKEEGGRVSACAKKCESQLSMP